MILRLPADSDHVDSTVGGAKKEVTAHAHAHPVFCYGIPMPLGLAVWLTLRGRGCEPHSAQGSLCASQALPSPGTPCRGATTRVHDGGLLADTQVPPPSPSPTTPPDA